MFLPQEWCPLRITNQSGSLWHLHGICHCRGTQAMCWIWHLVQVIRWFILVTVSHQHLEEFLAILHEVSHGYKLIMNPNKHMILAMKIHRWSGLDRNINHDSRILLLRREIGLESGIFYPQLKKTKKRYNYLCANMRYYSKDISFENQLWSAYVRTD